MPYGRPSSLNNSKRPSTMFEHRDASVPTGRDPASNVTMTRLERGRKMAVWDTAVCPTHARNAG